MNKKEAQHEYEKHLSENKEAWDSAYAELAEDRKRRKESKSMIKPGQKLKEGDFFIPESIDQLISISLCAHVGMNWYVKEFLQENFDKKYYPYYNQRFKMILSNSSELPFCKTEYDFADFRQLCENTFK